jgi:3-hydroxybutyrate dehydrogenase
MNIAMTERKPAAAQSLKDKVSLITGSTSGIGLGIARALAGAGSAIVLNGFGKPEEIEAVRDGVAKEFGVHVAYSGADMSNPASIAEMIEMTLDEFGRIDVLVKMPASNTWRRCRSSRWPSGTRSSPSI